jgi:two-component system, OmpR family, response regulator RegX3
MAKILVVEDDTSLSEALAYNLRREGYTPIVAPTAPGAIERARAEPFDLVLLDIMLPGGSGFDVCRDIRTFSTVPIVMITARDDEVDRVLGLEIGADDYVTKPFKLRELLARVKANLRRVDMEHRRDSGESLHAGPLSIDPARRRVLAGTEEIVLQPKEFDLLLYFMQHPRSVLTRNRLLHGVWGHEYVGERTVDVHVRRVRAKLDAAGVGGVIRTVHGVGYGFEPDAAAERDG